MTDIGAPASDPAAPPPHPGWYADAHGAWWWWDGATWMPAPAPGPAAASAPDRSQERTTAMIMWIVFLVGGGWIGALVFYLVSKDKPFVRHHAAEALNLTILLLPFQLVAMGLLVPDYVGWISDVVDDSTASFSPSGLFWLGIALTVVLAVVDYGLAIAGAVMSRRGRWWRLPLPFHPVRGVVPRGEEPYEVV